jgi:hypothetical protein
MVDVPLRAEAAPVVKAEDALVSKRIQALAEHLLAFSAYVERLDVPGFVR